MKSEPQRDGMDGVSIIGAVDAAALARDAVLRESGFSKSALETFARGKVTLQVWVTGGEEPRYKRLRVEETYYYLGPKGPSSAVSDLHLTLGQAVPQVALPPPYDKLPSRLVYQDNFTDTRSGFSTTVSDPETRALRYVPEEAEFSVSVLKPSGTGQRSVVAASILRGRTFGDFLVEVDVRTTQLLRSAAYGLVFRASIDSGYSLLISVWGEYRVSAVQRGTIIKDLSGGWKSSHVITGSNDHLMVLAIGPLIRLFVNGELLAEFRDETFSGGTIALRADGWLSPVEARFSGFQVFEP